MILSFQARNIGFGDLISTIGNKHIAAFVTIELVAFSLNPHACDSRVGKH